MLKWFWLRFLELFGKKRTRFDSVMMGYRCPSERRRHTEKRMLYNRSLYRRFPSPSTRETARSITTNTTTNSLWIEQNISFLEKNIRLLKKRMNSERKKIKRKKRGTNTSNKNLFHPNLSIFFWTSERMKIISRIFKKRQLVSGFNSKSEGFRCSMGSCHLIRIKIR